MTDCGCDKARRDLEEYMRNEMCRTEHSDIAEHLEQCAECRDEALVAQVRQSRDADTRAFEQLVRRHQRRVLANCRYMTNAHHDAEDLAQEVFVKAYFALEGFEGRSQFKTWLQRLKINHCLNYLRRRQGVTEVPLADDDDGDGAQVGSQPPTITRDRKSVV